MSGLKNLALKLHNPLQPRWYRGGKRRLYSYIPDKGDVLNLGSGNTVIQKGAAKVVNLDVVPYPNVDIVTDACLGLPFADSNFDCVFCNAVLEHTRMPWVVAEEIERVLRIGGVACIQAPFLEGVHDEHDYFRFTAKGLRSLFPGLEEVESGVSVSSFQTLADLVRAHPVLTMERTPFALPTKLVMGWLAKPIQWLDVFVWGSRDEVKYARAFYFVGRKK